MDATSVCGEAADCTASLSPFLRICWRASVRARVDGGTVFPPWRTRSLARLLSRRPAAARARSVLPWPPARHRLLADPSLPRGGDDSLRRVGVN